MKRLEIVGMTFGLILLLGGVTQKYEWVYTALPTQKQDTVENSFGVSAFDLFRKRKKAAPDYKRSDLSSVEAIRAPEAQKLSKLNAKSEVSEEDILMDVREADVVSEAALLEQFERLDFDNSYTMSAVTTSPKLMKRVMADPVLRNKWEEFNAKDHSDLEIKPEPENSSAEGI